MLTTKNFVIFSLFTSITPTRLRKKINMTEETKEIKTPSHVVIFNTESILLITCYGAVCHCLLVSMISWRKEVSFLLSLFMSFMSLTLTSFASAKA